MCEVAGNGTSVRVLKRSCTYNTTQYMYVCVCVCVCRCFYSTFVTVRLCECRHAAVLLGCFTVHRRHMVMSFTKGRWVYAVCTVCVCECECHMIGQVVCGLVFALEALTVNAT